MKVLSFLRRMFLKRMIICADDFGLRPDIDEAILELCALGKLNAVSCMALFERCSAASLGELRKFRGRVDIGLHLCLTPEPETGRRASRAQEPIIFSSFGTCLWRTGSGAVPKSDLVGEISAQYEVFMEKAGCAPDHIDGHLHIHQAPAMREALIEFVLSLAEKCRPYIRNTAMSIRELRRARLPYAKAWAIGILGKRMERRLRSAELRTNEGFAGIYDFKRHGGFKELLPRFVGLPGQRKGILVVHPGKTEAWRRREFEALAAMDFTMPPRRF